MAEETPGRATPPEIREAGVVLAGGRSRRMGRDKATLPWAGTTLLGHVLGVLAATVDGPLVVVGAVDRPPPPVPALPDAVAARVVRTSDRVVDGGPLEAIAVGLGACADAAERAFVASVDLPLLHPAFVRAVLDRLRPPVEVVLPVLQGHRQPLTAAYATALGARADGLLAGGAGRPGDLFAVARVVEPGAAELLADPALRAADPDLDAARGANTPAELAALAGRARPGPATGRHITAPSPPT